MLTPFALWVANGGLDNFPAWIKVEASINKTALKDLLKNGEQVFGAELTQGESIVIK